METLNLPGLPWPHRPRTIGISIHHTVTTPPGDNVDAERRHILAIHSYHQQPKPDSPAGYGGIGYHIVCFPASGRWWVVNPDLDIPRAGVMSRNHELIHVAIDGNYSMEVPPPAALWAAREAVGWLRFRYGVLLPVAGHRDWAVPESPTACPGGRWIEWIPRLTEEEDMGMTPEELTRLERLESVVAASGVAQAAEQTGGPYDLLTSIRSLNLAQQQLKPYLLSAADYLEWAAQELRKACQNP